MKHTNNNNMKKTVIGIALIATLAAPLLAFAQPSFSVYQNITNYTGVESFINKIASWVFGFFLALVIIFIVYAAFLFLTSGGDDEKVKTAKNYVIYAVIALAVALLARTLIGFVGTFLSG